MSGHKIWTITQKTLILVLVGGFISYQAVIQPSDAMVWGQTTGDINAYSVSINQLPVANAGLNQQFECTALHGTQVTLNGTDSFDPDGDPVSFNWTASGVVFDNSNSPTPTAIFPVGATTVTLVISDGKTNSFPTTVEISVQDTMPPSIFAQWVPVKIEKDEGIFTLRFSATDLCAPSPSVQGIIQTPSLDGLHIDLRVKDQVKVEFELDRRKVEIRGPNPQQVLQELQQLGGLVVPNGQSIKVEQRENGEREFKFEKDGTFKVEGPNAILLVTSFDAFGNTTTASFAVALP